MGGAISSGGGVSQDGGAPPGQAPTNTGGGSGVSAVDMGGPDVGGVSGGGSGVSVDADQGPGPFNKGGLAAKKLKKKPTRKMKKGGLATSKK